MWPFREKVNLQATCMSGILTCDGKHHTFTVWKDMTLTRTFYRPWMAGPVSREVSVQERTCVICHYRQVRNLDED